MQASLTVLGLWQYDNTILGGFVTPASIQPNILRDLIFTEAGELETIYPNPEIFKQILSSWSQSKLLDWNRIEKALTAEYSPIENYDRTEEHKDDYTRKLTEKGNSETETKKAAFNSNTLVTTDADSSDDQRNYTGGDNRVINIRAHGNIGVTTNQTMIRAEIEMRTKYNLYEIIVNDFVNKFCVGVY